MNSRSEIVAAIQKASSLAEQAELVTALDQYDANQRRVAADQRSIDLADAVVRETLSPTSVHEMHTASTDWLGTVEAADESDSQILAEAALWYNRVSPEVKADQEEFIEQAKGVMRRHAGAYGERAQAAYAAGMTYLAHLVRREAASGLDQIDQTVAPDGVTTKPTAIPTDVFDNFAPEVNSDNAGVVGTETSERNPLLQEINAEDGGQGQAEWGVGQWEENWSTTPNPEDHTASVAIGHQYNMDEFREMQAKEAASGLDQIEQTTAPDGVTEKPTPLPAEVMWPWDLGDENPMAQDDVKDGKAAIDKVKEAALDDRSPGSCVSCDSKLPGSGSVKCTNCGTTNHRQEKAMTGDEYKVGSRRADPNAGRVVKEADMFGNSDTVHSVPGQGVSNSPATIPHPKDTVADGKEDASVGNAPTVADGNKYPNYAEGYTQGMDELKAKMPKSVPSSLGGDNGNSKAAAHDTSKGSDDYEPHDFKSDGQRSEACKTCGFGRGAHTKNASLNKEARECANCTNGNHSGTNGGQGCTGGSCKCPANGCGKNNPQQNSGHMNDSVYESGKYKGKNTRSSLTPRTSALFVTVAAAENRDFKRAYAYASKWSEGTPLVKQGTAEFESGLYAGISDNPSHQNAWVQAHKKWAAKGNEDLERRVALHEAFTQKVATKLERDRVGSYLYVEAATTTDLDSLDPSASPSSDGSTPINGIGQPGPLEGQQDASAPGGAAPYNGAEPFGKAVVPSGRPVSSGDPKDKLVNDIPGGPLDGNAKAYAFRRQVQANLLNSKS